MKKLIITFIIGLVLLILGVVVFNFAGHKHHAKGFIVGIIGFILSGASGITLFQNRKFLKKNDAAEDVIDQ